MTKDKKAIISRIANLFEEVNNFDDNTQTVNDIRLRIINLLNETIRLLDSKKEFSEWEKEHIAMSIAALSSNLRNNSVAWLSLCLVCLEKALTDKSLRSLQYIVGDQVGSLSTDDYKGFLNELEKQVEKD